MIPISLRLTDFLSYRGMPEPLELGGITLACLSGANGHGKSALLDAMTWALWGRARGCEDGDNQDRLIRDGADAVSVELVFELEEQRFRVRRSRTRTGRSELLFAVRAGIDSWTDLAGEGILDTQRRITERLRMDYETFVTSAFILQGRADTFTRLTPANRKEVLGKILGLGVYERLAERAKERRKDAQAEAEARRAELGALERDLAARPEHERALADAEAAARAVEAERRALEPRVAQAERELTALRGLEAAAAEAARHAREADARAAGEAAEAQRLRERAAELAGRARADPALERRAAALAALEARERDLEEARTRFEPLAEDARSLEGRIEQERVRLETRTVALEGRELEISGRLAREPEARGVLEAAGARMGELDALATRREELLQRHREAAARLGALEAEAAERERQRAQLEDKLDLIEGEGASCPLCGEPLTPAHRREIRRALRAETRSLRSADARGTAEAERSRGRAAEIEREGTQLRAGLEERDRMAASMAELRAELASFEELRAELSRLGREREPIGRALEAADYATAEREKLRSVRAEMDAVGYDPQAPARLRERLAEAREAQARLRDAQVAAAELAQVRATLEGALARLGAAERDALQARAAAEGFGARLAGVPEAEARVSTLAGERRRLEERGGVAMRDRALAQAALSTLDRKEDEARLLRAGVREATREAGLGEKLSRIFGRDGIPARIVANAIPEVRAEANALLGALTDGQLAISIDPLRETKAKTVKETLDITVYDARGGKRAYDMYSGGERLRIDFALRVALSRLLARRAGARLETLVVDEGFGSQDAEGRARLVEAILRIRGLFRLILVVTHLEELKEQFPTRIEVTKDDVSGSRARIA